MRRSTGDLLADVVRTPAEPEATIGEPDVKAAGEEVAAGEDFPADNVKEEYRFTPSPWALLS